MDISCQQGSFKVNIELIDGIVALASIEIVIQALEIDNSMVYQYNFIISESIEFWFNLNLDHRKRFYLTWILCTMWLAMILAL